MVDILVSLIVVLGIVSVVALRVRTYDRSLRGLLWLAVAEQLGATAALLFYARGFAGGSDSISYGIVGTRLADFLDTSFSQSAPELLAMLLQQPSRFDPLTFSTANNTGSVYAASAWLIYVFRSPDYGVPLVLSGLSLFSRLSIFRACSQACPEAPIRPLFAWTVLFPSVAFWTSTITKEAFCVIGIGPLLYGWRCLYRGDWIRGTACIAVGAALILLFRAPALPPLVLGITIFWLLERLQRAKGASTILVGPIYSLAVVGVLAATAILMSRVAPSLAPDKLTETVANQHAGWAPTQGGSTIGDTNEEMPQTPAGILLRMPVGLLNALLRPQLFDVHNVATLISAIEMTTIAYFVFRAVRRGGVRLWRDVRASPFLVMCLVITIVGCGLVGLVTLNLGSLSRYRAPFLPFYGALLAVLSERAVRLQRAPRSEPSVRVLVRSDVSSSSATSPGIAEK